MGVLIMPTCETYRFWVESSEVHAEGYRICKRYPPKMFVDEEGGVSNYRPMVSKDDLCGEHMPRLIG